MTDFESIARLRLVVDNRYPTKLPERNRALDLLYGLSLVVAVMASVWFMTCVMFSIEALR